MRTVISVCSLIGVVAIGWQYLQLAATKTAVESSLVDATRELKMANAQVSELSAPKSQSNPNWLEDRTRNWQSPLK